MDDDLSDAAWHQLECEHRQMLHLLNSDPDYFKWLEQVERENDESQRNDSVEVPA
jgi:hypothetical protein